MQLLTLKAFFDAQGNESACIQTNEATESTPVNFGRMPGFVEIMPPSAYGPDSWAEYLKDINAGLKLRGLAKRNL